MSDAPIPDPKPVFVQDEMSLVSDRPRLTAAELRRIARLGRKRGFATDDELRRSTIVSRPLYIRSAENELDGGAQ
jgi:hypothetical protein